MNARFFKHVKKWKIVALGCICSLFLLLCIVLLVIFQLWRITNDPQTIQDKLAIKQVYSKFENSIRYDDFAQAYTLMSPSYKEREDLELFISRFRGLQKVDDSLGPQHFISVRKNNTAWLYPKGPSQRSGASYEFEKIHSRWYLTGRMSIIKD